MTYHSVEPDGQTELASRLTSSLNHRSEIVKGKQCQERFPHLFFADV
jgi:hypothetical protein